ncbi:permease [Haloarcula sp. S1CR25-12]|uniref:Permease n=1 Tax=Haloarcula saliterrae TaxID=2950534 RepID=A0ABU2FF63_9EURY|nr:permease [Haloarcula sp. S1CR25-12]MDS0260583.1 permease [Haloarcula sp. S1CR25-12]
MVLEAFVRLVTLVGEMVWDTWWALVLGFALSGAVEAFVSEERMQRALGDDGWEQLGLAGVLGAASSSCSYSAVGTTKTLFKKGASGAASLGVFMFASTDLVVELGLVMFVLLGWQFVVGEYFGGIVAVLVLAAIFKYLVPEAWVETAREHARAADGITCGGCDAEMDPEADDALRVESETGVEHFCCGGCQRVYEARTDETVGWREHLASPEGWKSAARASMKDWEMLWDDIAVGFVVAGLAGALIPAAWWAALFPAEATVGGVVAATALAVGIGVVTFMCSVGNVPFALVLWTNGLPFGAVLSFIYADLLIPPLVNVYRRYYGARMAAVLTVSLTAAAFVAGIAAHYLVGLTIAPPTGTVGGTVPDSYTLALNAVFTPVFLAQAYLVYGREGLARRVDTVVGALTRALAVAVGLGAGALVLARAVWIWNGHFRRCSAPAREQLGGTVRRWFMALTALVVAASEAWRLTRERLDEEYLDDTDDGSGPLRWVLHRFRDGGGR